jgi:hypothetical protein
MKPVALIPEVDTEGLGPEMLALSPRQRKFVIAYIGSGGRDAAACARAAGYTTSPGADRVAGHRLLHTPKVIEAIKVESDRHLNGAAYVAASGLVDIAADPEHRDRFRACADILDRTGFPRTTQHAVTVEHEFANVSTAELLRTVAEYQRKVGRVIEGQIVHSVSDAQEPE